MHHLCRASFILLLLALAGCSSAAKSPPQTPPAASRAAAGSPEAKLRALADHESTSRPLNGFVAVPHPPGVDSASLALHDVADERARQALADVLAMYADRLLLGAEDEQPPVDPEAATEALKRYTKARAAALDGRMLQAIIELQKANELDPTSVEILRELARCYLAENRTSQAVDVYEKLIRLEPNNVDALFALGLATANRRDFENSLGALARLERIKTDIDREPDPAAEILVKFTIATSLRELGYDRAFIEAAEAAIDFPEQIMATENAVRLAPVYRQRGELRRAIGDAYCRLGEFQQALKAYRLASTLPLADPNALAARIAYANLCLNRPHSAQLAVFELFNRGQGDRPASEISAREIRLCAYVKEQVGEATLLAEAMGDLYRRQPDDSMLMRAAAAVATPEAAREILRDFVARKPRDLEGVGELLAWISTPPHGSAAQAADLVLTLAAEHPDLADQYAERLAIAVPRAGELMAALESLPQSPHRARMQVKLLWRVGGLGEAWSVSHAARERWPEDRPLAVQHLQLAAALQEHALFDQTRAAAPPLDDVTSLLGLSQAYRAIGRTEESLEIVEHATQLEPDNLDAQVELARVHLARAATLADKSGARAEARKHIDEAILFAERVIEQDPKRETAYEVLALIYAPGGPLADTDHLQSAVLRLRDSNPASSLLARLAAQEFIGQRRYDQAIERLLHAYDTNPTETSNISLAVSVWQQAGKLDAADAWISERLAKRPGDPALLEQWVRVQLLRDRADVAINRLEDAMAADDHDILARRLLETVYRATGRTEAALDLGEQRLKARPQGMRREIELAALYAGAEWNTQALERLEWIRANASQATAEELASTVRIIDRVDQEGPKHDQLTLEFVHLAVEKEPESPLQVYGAGLRSLARMGNLGEEFDTLADAAAAHAKGASGSTVQAAQEWRELAQALVDDGRPAAAAKAMRARLRSSAALDDVPRGMLTIIALAADAAAQAADPQTDYTVQSVQLVRDLEQRGKLHIIFDSASRSRLADAIYEVSVFYTIVGARQAADRLLEQVIAFNPDHSMALNNLGYAMLEAGRTDQRTVEMIERAIELEPEEANILDTVGWLRYKQGRFADQPDENGEVQPGAQSFIENSIKKSRLPSPEVLDHLGDVHWRLGDKPAAVQAWQQAVKVIEDDTYRKLIVQSMYNMQIQNWQLLVMDPQTMYDRDYGPIVERARKKIAAADAGEDPPVAPIFQEY